MDENPNEFAILPYLTPWNLKPPAVGCDDRDIFGVGCGICGSHFGYSVVKLGVQAEGGRGFLLT